MTIDSKTSIKSYFERGDRPTSAQFSRLIDSLAVLPVSAAASGVATGFMKVVSSTQSTAQSLISASDINASTFIQTFIENVSTTAQARDYFATTSASGPGGGAIGQAILNSNVSASVVSLLSDAQLVSQQVFTSAQTTTWSRPDSVTMITVEVVGAGGGGGGTAGTGAGQNAAGGGGGGGGYSKLVANATGITSSTIIIGVPGSGGSGNSAGASGAVTSWDDGTNTITISGGPGGGAGAVNSDDLVRPGAVGGTATGGDINIRGHAGQGSVTQTAVNQALGGNGGGGPWGGGAVGAFNAQVPVTAADDSGGGGGGAANQASQSADTGTRGASGIVIVTEYGMR